MTWFEFNVARRFLAEERIGTRLRAAGAEEDDDFAQAMKHASRG